MKLSAVCGAPGRIRTHGPLIRSQVLYPAELPVLILKTKQFIIANSHGYLKVSTG